MGGMQAPRRGMGGCKGKGWLNTALHGVQFAYWKIREKGGQLLRYCITDK